MIHSSLIRLLMLPVVLLMTLMACNLSSSAGTSTESLQVIITATSNALVETDIEASSEIEADEDDTITETIQTSNQTVQQITSISNQAVGGEDLYYVRGSRSATQCAIRASVTTNIRTASNTSASIVGQLVGGEWVPISRIVNGWYQIDLSGTPAHRMWISSDPTELDEFCRCETNGCARSQTIPTPTVNDNWYYAGNPMPAPPSGCFVFTAGDFNVNIRVAQSETSTILGQLRANHWIPVRHLINGWFGITAPNTPIDGAYIASGPLQLSSTCLCTDVSCTVRTDAISCELTTHANTVTKVRTEPAN